MIAWALAAVDADQLVSAISLRDGGPPWLVRCTSASGERSVVVRVGAPDSTETQRFEVLARTCPERRRPSPVVIASRVDDEAALLLVEYVEGSSYQPDQLEPARLEALGAMAARISAVDARDAELPTVTRPIRLCDFDELRSRAAAASSRRRAGARYRECA